MRLPDILILATVFALAICAYLVIRKRKKKGNMCGNCGGCSACHQQNCHQRTDSEQP